ncbi:MAG: hypothetical protein IKA79_00015 [Lentisphaeria bacterium]|nr:hypothetical protein [Lentisphaeria bacterium]
MSKEKQTQMTFDFGFDDRTDSGSLPEVVDIGDAEDSLGLPPSDDPEGEESLSFSSPDEDEEYDEFSNEDIPENGMEIEGVEILTGEEDPSSENSLTEEEISEEDFSSSGDEKESIPPSVAAESEEEREKEEVIFIKKKKALSFDAKNVKRAALAFLASLSPDGLAGDVPTRYRKYAVDGAAFWSRTGKKGKVEICRTAVVDVMMKEDSGNIAGDKNILPLLAEAKNTLALIEERLRNEAPSLKVRDTLFSDEDRWDYSKTEDSAYHETVARIRELEKKLFAGTRFDKLRKSGAASEYYAVVPENLIDISSVAREWGLVYILPDLSFRLVKEAGKLPCTEESMTSLALNIGRMSLQNVLFANGLIADENTVKVTRLPRKRRM